MQQLTWLEASKLPNGTRVVFIEPHDIFPEAIIPAGTVCTVVEQALNEMQAALILKPESLELQKALEGWNGDIWLSPRLDESAGNRDYAWQSLSAIARAD